MASKKAERSEQPSGKRVELTRSKVAYLLRDHEICSVGFPGCNVMRIKLFRPASWHILEIESVVENGIPSMRFYWE